MPFQSLLTDKAFFAVRTLKGLFAGVRAQVPLQMGWHCKYFIAVRAGKLFFFCMGPSMISQHYGGGKPGVTKLTDKRFFLAMNCQVCIQVTGLPEGFVTVLTWVRFHSSVNSHVYLQVSGEIKRLHAKRAWKGSVCLVHVQMMLQ